MNKKEQEFLVQKIRTQYTEREHTQLDELKKLDTKVKTYTGAGKLTLTTLQWEQMASTAIMMKILAKGLSISAAVHSILTLAMTASIPARI